MLPLLIAACRPDESTQEPPDSVQESAAEAAVSTDAVAGTYALVAVNDEPLPGAVAGADGVAAGCEVQLAGGTLDLGADAEYALDVLARAACDDERAELMDRATSEGPYTVEGFELRFGTAVTDADYAAWEDRVSEELVEDDLEDAREDALGEDAAEELYDAGAFAGRGTLRDSLLTVRLDDGLTTLSFVKE
jgi:hypothetical protein